MITLRAPSIGLRYTSSTIVCASSTRIWVAGGSISTTSGCTPRSTRSHERSSPSGATTCGGEAPRRLLDARTPRADEQVGVHRSFRGALQLRHRPVLTDDRDPQRSVTPRRQSSWQQTGHRAPDATGHVFRCAVAVGDDPPARACAQYAPDCRVEGGTFFGADRGSEASRRRGRRVTSSTITRSGSASSRRGSGRSPVRPPRPRTTPWYTSDDGTYRSHTTHPPVRPGRICSATCCAPVRSHQQRLGDGRDLVSTVRSTSSRDYATGGAPAPGARTCAHPTPARNAKPRGSDGPACSSRSRRRLRARRTLRALRARRVLQTTRRSATGSTPQRGSWPSAVCVIGASPAAASARRIERHATSPATKVMIPPPQSAMRTPGSA